MSEYGYIPESPAQSFGNNKGIFTPNDIYDLTRADKYTQYGQLELIQTQTVDDADHSEEISAGSPDNKFTTPGGTPASLQISTSSMTLPGVITSGLHITEQPAAKEVEIFLEAKTIGKFQGTRAATTPTGW